MNALNDKNLFAFGILEEAQNTYEETIEASYTAHTATFDLKLYKSRNDMVGHAVKITLNRFIESNRYIFTNNAEHIYLNNHDAYLFNQYAGLSRSRYFKTTPLPSFNTFFSVLETIICIKLLHSGRFPDMPGKYVTDDRIIIATERMNERINRLAAVYRSRLFQSEHSALPERIIAPKLVIFKSLRSLSCSVKKHKIIPESVPMWIVEKNISVNIPVHKCCTCGRTFIGAQTLKLLVPEYGFPFFSRTYDSSYPPDYSLFKQSELYSYGYNVQAAGMSRETRRALIKFLYTTKTMTYFEIVRDIENNINHFERCPSFSLAIKKWKEDLRYVSNLVQSYLNCSI